MRKIAFGIVGLMIAGACTGTTPTGSGSPAPTGSATASSPAPTGSDPASDSPSALLLSSVEGYPDLTAESALTLDQAAALSPDPAGERGALEQAGFVRGHIRLFSNDDGDAVQVLVYEVRDAASAETLREFEHQDTLKRGSGERFAVPGIAGADGITAEIEAGAGTAFMTGVAFTRGPRLYFVAVLSPGRRPTSDEAIRVAKAQAAVAR